MFVYKNEPLIHESKYSQLSVDNKYIIVINFAFMYRNYQRQAKREKEKSLCKYLILNNIEKNYFYQKVHYINTSYKTFKTILHKDYVN